MTTETTITYKVIKFDESVSDEAINGRVLACLSALAHDLLVIVDATMVTGDDEPKTLRISAAPSNRVNSMSVRMIGTIDPVRWKALERSGIDTLGKLQRCTRAQVLAIYDIGEKTVFKIEGWLRERGLGFKLYREMEPF